MRKKLAVTGKLIPIALLVIGLGIAVVAVSGNSPLFNYSRAEESQAQPAPVNVVKTGCTVTATISWEKKSGYTGGYIVMLAEGKASDDWSCGDEPKRCFFKANWTNREAPLMQLTTEAPKGFKNMDDESPMPPLKLNTSYKAGVFYARINRTKDEKYIRPGDWSYYTDFTTPAECQ